MGGALASLFALVLHLKRPHSSQQVAGIYTFGSCPAGDEAFVRKLQAAYPQRLVVHQHPGDVCSLWCPPGGYASPSGDACSALPQGALSQVYAGGKAVVAAMWLWLSSCSAGMDLPYTVLQQSHALLHPVAVIWGACRAISMVASALPSGIVAV